MGTSSVQFLLDEETRSVKSNNLFTLGHCCNLNVRVLLASPGLYVEILAPLGHEDGALMNAINALMTQAPGSSLAPSIM